MGIEVRLLSRAVASIAVILAVAACATSRPRDATVAATRAGFVQGARDGEVLTWKGIPFARPPIGDLRWRAPQPPARWDGVRPALRHASDCMQTPFARDAAPLGTTPSEDCLYLNVWRPAAVGSNKLPVLVWIFGGGFVNGGASPAVYDGAALARRGVVVVSFNYRLGRFGFFAHPALTAANADRGLFGNYGYMDQIAALRWVRDNIAAFGGDAGNVTVFGESAGGMSVLVLATSSRARGLFKRAVVMSGLGRDEGAARRLPIHAASGPDAEDAGLAFARWAGIEGEGPDALAKLRALDAATLARRVVLFAPPPGQGDPPPPSGPMLDGVIAVEPPETAFRAGRASIASLMVGATTADLGFPDADPFAAFGAESDRARAAYIASVGADAARLARAVAADRLIVEPARMLAGLVVEHGGDAWHYRAGYVPTAKRGVWADGLPHASELPQVFGTLEQRLPGQVTDEDRAVSAAFSAYLVNFARTGNPNGDGLPVWRRYDGLRRPVMQIGPTKLVGGADPWRMRLDLVEASAEPRAAAPSR